MVMFFFCFEFYVFDDDVLNLVLLYFNVVVVCCMGEIVVNFVL